MNIALKLLLMSAAVLVAAACAPQTAAERAYFEQKEAERVEKVALKNQVIEAGLKDSDIINMVAASPAPDSVGTTDDWLKRQVGVIGGQILFPRWKVVRQGGAKYEARYQFSVIDDQNQIARRGYQWQVDVLIKQVSAPRQITAEQKSAAAPVVETKHSRRIRDEEASLE